MSGLVVSSSGLVSYRGNPIRENRRSSKKTFIALSAATAFAGAFAAGVGGTASIAHGDTFDNIWATDGNLTTLNTPGAWTNITGANPAPPGASDIAQFEATTGLTGATTFTLGVSTSWMGLSVISPGAAVTIGGTGDTSNTLTIGASGINMSSATSNLTIADPLALSTTQTLQVNTGTTFTNSTTTALNGNLTVAGAGNAVFTGAITAAASAVTMNGTGTLTLTASNAIANGVTLDSGTTILGTSSGAGGTSSAGPTTATITMNGGTLRMTGSTSGANGYYNPVFVESASGIASGGQMAGNITGSGQLNVTVGANSTLSFMATAGMLSSYGGLIEMGTSAGTLRLNGVTGGSNFGLDMGTATATLNTRGGGTYTLGSLAGGSGTFVVGATSSNAADTFSIGGLNASTVMAGTIQNGTGGSSATTAINLTGGTLTLTGTNPYTGGTTIGAAATLQVGNNTATGTMGTNTVTLNGKLVFNRSDSAYSAGNAITSTGVFVNNGTGTVTMTGLNTFSGGSTLNFGLLQVENVTNALGTNTITVNSGAALGGIGTITAPVTVASGGILSPGDVGVNHGAGTGVGTLSEATLTLASGSILSFDMNGSAGNDLLNVTGTNGLTVNGGGINLYNAGTTNAFETNGTYNIFQLNAPFSGSVTNLLNILNAQAGVSYTWGTSGNDITLAIAGGLTSTAWNVNGGGSWIVAGNWTSGVPNGQGASATFGSIVSATATVSLNGSETVGNLTFNDASGGASPTYTIDTGSGGTLVIDNGSNGAGGITVSNGSQAITAPVVLNSSLGVSVAGSGNTMTISGQISGSGGLSMVGTGALVLAGSNSYAGPTSITSGTLQIGNGGASGSFGTDTGSISNGGALVFDLSSSLAVPNVITGSGSLTQAGTGTTTLSGTNTYTGTTNINAGTLQYGTGDPSALNTGKVAFGGTGGTLDVNGNSVSLASISGTVGAIDNVSAGGTATVTINNGSTNTFGGTIKNTSGTVVLVKSGSGVLALTGTNTYTGGTTITAGAVKVSGSSALGTGTVQVGTGTTGTNGLQLANGAVVSNPIVTDVGSNEFEDVPDAGAIATISGSINLLTTSAQQLRIGTSHLNGTGVPDSTLILTGAASSSTSQAILTRGNIIFEQNGSLTTSSNIIVGRNTSAAILFLTIEGNGAINSNGAQISGNNSSSDAIETTVNIQDNGVFNAGTGTMNINDSANTGSGAVSVNMSNNAEIAAGAWTILAKGVQPTFFTINSGTLRATANDPSGGQWFPALTNTNGAISATVGAGVNIDNGGFGITVGQSFGDGGGGFINFIGSGSTTIKASNSYSGNDSVTGGTLVIADTVDNSALGTGSTLTLNAGSTLASSPTSPGTPISISQSVVPGSGSQTIAPGTVGAIGTLSLAGLTTNNQTTLNFDLGTGTGTVTNGDELLLGSGSIASGTMMTFGGTPVGGNDYRLIGGSIGGINLANFSLQTIPGFALSLSTSVDSGWIDLVVVSTGPASLTWNNAGGNNQWDIATTANWNSGSSNANYSDGSLVTFNDSNPSNTTANYNVSLNTTVSPASVTVNNSNGNYVISGTGRIAGTTALSKSGSGNLTLDTVNTYTGGTSVSAGTLVVGVNGALPSGAVSVTGGAVQLAASTGGATVTSLSVTGGGKFDVNNNHLVINYGAPANDPVSSVRAMLITGFNNGAWNGPGIDSSAAAATAGYALGYADAADPGNPAGLASGTVEVEYTLIGDADLNRTVNGIDFGILAANFNKTVTAWDQGDFDYNGIVNGIDFTALASNFNKATSGASAGATAADFAALEQFAAANGLLADVPEPASLGLLAVGACGLMARRRRLRS
jgi:autotransporter-associated beta strand protein